MTGSCGRPARLQRSLRAVESSSFKCRCRRWWPVPRTLSSLFSGAARLAFSLAHRDAVRRGVDSIAYGPSFMSRLVLPVRFVTSLASSWVGIRTFSMPMLGLRLGNLRPQFHDFDLCAQKRFALRAEWPDAGPNVRFEPLAALASPGPIADRSWQWLQLPKEHAENWQTIGKPLASKLRRIRGASGHVESCQHPRGTRKQAPWRPFVSRSRASRKRFLTLNQREETIMKRTLLASTALVAMSGAAFANENISLKGSAEMGVSRTTGMARRHVQHGRRRHLHDGIHD